MKTNGGQLIKERDVGARLTILVVRAFLLAAFLFTGCGVKTHPYPESSVLPGPPRQLSQTQEVDGQLWLTWLAPTLNMANRPLLTLDHFEVWGADYAQKGFCASCPSEFRKLAEVYLKPAAPGLNVNEGPYQWVTKIEPDRVYRFKVAGFSGRGAVNPQSWREITVYGQISPGRLAHFSAELDDQTTRLTWSKPKAGQKVEIQKLAPGRGWVTLDTTGSPQGSMVDLAVVYGQTYFYRARLLVETGQSLTPGPFGPEIIVKVEDLSPPRPIGFLDAAYAPGGGVSLRWENLALEEELAGYRVYRRLAKESAFQAIAGLISDNQYHDSGVNSGETAYYQVTAVDRSPAANESRPSPIASVLAAPEESEPERPPTLDPGL
ncbi:MAG: hypothetical protein LBT86_04030 [Deltaproteobacteria bacterium]|jgi:hypothetical protein|nr:hypothetical protein [Deltaproteobacteria bacterium]